MNLTSTKVLCVIACLLVNVAVCKKSEEGNKPKWAKKKLQDYNDVDLERLLDQWEEDEEPLPDDELPEHLRKPEPMDLSNLDTSDPEKLLKLTKKGKTLMMFVTVDGKADREETERITTLWQGSLFNNHIQCDRFLVDDSRAIFMFKDGSQAWDAKDFLVEQEGCKEVSIDNKIYEGRYKPEKKKKAKVEL
ncbi:LDLR chaperone boca-like [Pollicipes pollicipes]|uniref:LDLR chaperone boca-like n=1 Tax=Pollicipes pollicipes TaxID=41117 RepID=UPI001884FF3D|nr:LDLR chaperone boca-like [Pollicipes pollicipes]